MLNSLLIKNVALIDSAEIIFKNGLNVLSGETGAGKSVILESINFVLGAKADKTLIRSNETECFVKAEFDISSNLVVKNLLKDFDLEDDDVLIISRKFNIDGKSVAKINGSTVTVGMLKEITANIVDVHGQSEHFYLLKTSNQLDLIDKFGQTEVLNLKEEIKNEYSVYKKLLNEVNSFGTTESERLTKIDILDYQIKEIENANVKENEEENLLELKQKLLNQEKIITSLNAIKQALGGEDCAVDLVSFAEKYSSGIIDYANDYKELYSRLSSVNIELSDINDFISNLLDNFTETEDNLDVIEERLSLIKKIKQKYGNTLDEINTFLQNSINEKETLENFTTIYKDKLKLIEQVKQSLYKKYVLLSNLRRKISKDVEKDVVLELKELGIPKGNFVVKFVDLPSFEECLFDSSNGIDKIEFLFSSNVGEPLKNLSSVISGGEMSRFMLAIKTKTSKYNNISTFIFDEIDAGISGNIAKIVAEKFIKIAKNTQVIAVSHLPQISAMADNNLLIYKSEVNERAQTNVVSLSEEEKINEIIRLVGGDVNSIVSKNHAIDIIEKANLFKKSI